MSHDADGGGYACRTAGVARHVRHVNLKLVQLCLVGCPHPHHDGPEALHYRSYTCDEEGLIGFGEMVLQVNPPVACHDVPVKTRGRKQFCLLNGRVGFVDHLWLCVQGLRDYRNDEAHLRAVEQVFDGQRRLPCGAPVPLVVPLLVWGGLVVLDTESVERCGGGAIVGR